MDEAQAKFMRFKILTRSLPGISPMYLISISAMELDSFLDLIKTTYQKHLEDGTLVSKEPEDISMMILIRADVQVDKMAIDMLYRFCAYIKYFLCLALEHGNWPKN